MTPRLAATNSLLCCATMLQSRLVTRALSLRRLALTAVIWCSPIAAGCGSTASPSPAVHASERVPARTTGAASSPIVAHVRGRLVGDEDDDDEPVKRTGSERDFDSDGDGDYKDSYSGYFDRDDTALRAYGSAPSPTARQAIVAVAKRYLAAEAAGDGAIACKMLYPVIAAAVTEDYGQAPAPQYLWGKTCPDVMGKLFGHEQARFRAPVEIVSVRVHRMFARVFLGSSTLPASSLQLHRVRGTWRVGGLIQGQLP